VAEGETECLIGFKVQGSKFKDCFGFAFGELGFASVQVSGECNSEGFPYLLTDIMNSPPASRLRRDRLSLLRKEG